MFSGIEANPSGEGNISDNKKMPWCSCCGNHWCYCNCSNCTGQSESTTSGGSSSGSDSANTMFSGIEANPSGEGNISDNKKMPRCSCCGNHWCYCNCSNCTGQSESTTSNSTYSSRPSPQGDANNGMTANNAKELQDNRETSNIPESPRRYSQRRGTCNEPCTLRNQGDANIGMNTNNTEKLQDTRDTSPCLSESNGNNCSQRRGTYFVPCYDPCVAQHQRYAPSSSRNNMPPSGSNGQTDNQNGRYPTKNLKTSNRNEAYDYDRNMSTYDSMKDTRPGPSTQEYYESKTVKPKKEKSQERGKYFYETERKKRDREPKDPGPEKSKYYHDNDVRMRGNRDSNRYTPTPPQSKHTRPKIPPEPRHVDYTEPQKRPNHLSFLTDIWSNILNVILPCDDNDTQAGSSSSAPSPRSPMSHRSITIIQPKKPRDRSSSSGDRRSCTSNKSNMTRTTNVTLNPTFVFIRNAKVYMDNRRGRSSSSESRAAKRGRSGSSGSRAAASVENLRAEKPYCTKPDYTKKPKLAQTCEPCISSSLSGDDKPPKKQPKDKSCRPWVLQDWFKGPEKSKRKKSKSDCEDDAISSCLYSCAKKMCERKRSSESTPSPCREEKKKTKKC
ncbi:uncharacterized protein LOC108252119 [Diaphorina citri]|uniref:Uncharacterized protein LOC108252119 n=1 Tax=Diaphorina citri TaxID=121845 RepID=A0A1S4E917_DIACI|nr:uncharacterized protein LOC108252119 [Diaphorina citri]